MKFPLNNSKQLSETEKLKRELSEHYGVEDDLNERKFFFTKLIVLIICVVLAVVGVLFRFGYLENIIEVLFQPSKDQMIDFIMKNKEADKVLVLKKSNGMITKITIKEDRFNYGVIYEYTVIDGLNIDTTFRGEVLFRNNLIKEMKTSKDWPKIKKVLKIGVYIKYRYLSSRKNLLIEVTLTSKDAHDLTWQDKLRF